MKIRAISGEHQFEILEPDDGRYYVADTGNVLHADRLCGHLWSSSNVRRDRTRTLAYRMIRDGAEVNIVNEEGGRVVAVCWDCCLAYSRPKRHLRAA